MTNWIFESRAVSDPGHVFYRCEFKDEKEAREHYRKNKTHAELHGGAGSLSHNGQTVAQFSHWTENE